MKHFLLVEKDIDVRPILDEVQRHDESWNVETGRSEKVKVQRDARVIPIRGLRLSRIRGRRRRDVHESRYTRLSDSFPAVRKFLEAFATDSEGELGRARLVRLPGSGHVHPHVDRGDYYRLRDRYHLVLQSTEGSHLRAADEEVWMRTGELWWFDNKQLHEARNEAKLDRIHLIFDLLPLAQQRRRGPEPRPTGFENMRDIRSVWKEARQCLERHDAEIVQQGVRLYLVGRTSGERWERFLTRHGYTRPKDRARPIGAIAEMLCGSHNRRVGPRVRCAMIWSIERIEAGALTWEEIPQAIETTGGLRAVARSWMKEQRKAGYKSPKTKKATTQASREAIAS